MTAEAPLFSIEESHATENGPPPNQVIDRDLQSQAPVWKIIVVDDEVEVHAITRLVLRRFSFEGRPVQLLFGTSGAEAVRLLHEHPDAAILLLDVVMEVESAGLDVVRHVRDEMQNHFIRIIIRTGQPGNAPEEEVFSQYEINDYKEKSFLTGQGLVTSILSALRSYRDLRALENMRKGLTRIIGATEDLFKPNSIKTLASGILTQLAAIIGLEHNGMKSDISCLACSNRRGTMRVYAGTGRFEQAVGSEIKNVVSAEAQKRIEESLAKERSLFFDHCYLGYFKTALGINLIFMEGHQPIGHLERKLVEVFSANITFAFDNLSLNREVIETQREVTFTLGEVIEVRSQETGHHVRRVALISKLLASKLGLEEAEADILYMSSPLHDLGKIGIPDPILNKQGPLDPEERRIMQEHARIGNDILKNSSRSILKAGSIIAYQHHERWDGTGYPQGLKGDRIHIFARITAIADVFDALSSDRCYRKAWPMDRVMAFFHEEKGRHFDPTLVDLLFDQAEILMQIKNNLKDL
ncbi:MAG: DUF3369 domain-containing protein [Magnetococcales bacterium]|nr:DUF3369 domain-containing protein [Magnetococcales bacterium]